MAVGGEYLYHQADGPLSVMEDNLGGYDRVDDGKLILSRASIALCIHILSMKFSS